MSHSRILVLDNSNYDCDQIFEEMQSYGNGVDYVDDSMIHLTKIVNGF